MYIVLLCFLITWFVGLFRLRFVLLFIALVSWLFDFVLVNLRCAYGFRIVCDFALVLRLVVLVLFAIWFVSCGCWLLFLWFCWFCVCSAVFGVGIRQKFGVLGWVWWFWFVIFACGVIDLGIIWFLLWLLMFCSV